MRVVLRLPEVLAENDDFHHKTRDKSQKSWRAIAIESRPFPESQSRMGHSKGSSQVLGNCRTFLGVEPFILNVALGNDISDVIYDLSIFADSYGAPARPAPKNAAPTGTM
jgi:hypothetical protein